MKHIKRILPVALLAGLVGQAMPLIAAPVSGAGDPPGNTVQATAGSPSSDASDGNSQASKENNVKKLSAVVVTGSHIRRVELETANPVLTVSHEQIMATGDLTLGKLVQDLPVMTGGASNPQYAHSHGGTQLSMRGLGSSRTLILVDGRRVLSSDVSSIPAAMIERIEVLKNGASAVYGSDAIGGVVNFITRKHYQGAQFSARYGQSSQADARGRGYTFTFGHSTDKGSIIAGVGYNKTDGVPSSARDFTANVLSLEADSQGIPQVYVGGSTNSPYGNIQIPNTGAVHDAFSSCSSGYLARNPGASGMDPINDYHCYQYSGANTDKYNYASDTQLLKPQERTNAFVLGNYRLGRHVSVYLDAYYNKSHAAFEEAPTTYHTPQVTISADNYYNPFGVEFGRHGYHFRSRLLGMGLRAEHYETNVAQVSTGFKGDFSMFNDQRWQWNVGMNYGHRYAGTLTLNYPNLDKLYTGPSFMDPNTGKVTCGTPSAPIAHCDASFNPFNIQSPNSVAAEKAATTPAIEYAYSQERIWQAEANGGLFDVPAGTVQLALGADYRQEHQRSVLGSLLIIDPATGNCGLGTHCSAPLQGGYNVKDAYGELFVPILADKPWAYGLNATIGDRYSKFSSFGSTNNMEYKLEWRPVRSLLLRGSMEEVFRAPTISDVYTSVSTANPRITYDPCDGYTGSPSNPACVNVPTDGSFVDSLVAQNVASAITQAGADYAGFPIKPEKGKSFDVGAVYSPGWVHGLTVSVDVWHVYLHDLITSVNLQNMLNLCSAGQTQYCSLIHRYPSGPQQGQISQQTVEPIGNLGSLSTGGTDLSADYKLETASFGRFDFNLNATYLKYYTAQTAPGTRANSTYHYAGHYMGAGSAPASDCPGVGQCLFPRWRANGVARWQMNHWQASWKVRYIGGFRMGSPAPSQDTHPAGSGLNGFYIDYGATLYHDVSLSYDFKPAHTRVILGVNNVFDKQPPMLYDNNAAYNVDELNFDLIGRYYWARLVVSY